MLYSFGEWELDVELYELCRGHELVRLEPQVFNVLAYLVQHHDRIISKQELLTQLWPDQYIGDSALERCIMSARKAVGDNGCKQKIIKTFNRRGYRVIVPVAEIAPKSESMVQSSAIVTPGLNCAESAQERRKQQDPCLLAPPSFPQNPVSKLAPQGQRVTILSCEFGTAHALLETVAIEDRQTVSQLLNDQIVLLVEEYGGLVAHFQDNGFLALFGLASSVDHAWQAVQAALELQHRRFDIFQGLKTLSQEMSFCCGLHTGAVIEKRLRGLSQVVYIAVDDELQVAANLCSCAEPGRILVSDVTYKLIKDVAGERVVSRLAAVIAEPTSLVAYDLALLGSSVSIVESTQNRHPNGEKRVKSNPKEANAM